MPNPSSSLERARVRACVLTSEADMCTVRFADGAEDETWATEEIAHAFGWDDSPFVYIYVFGFGEDDENVVK